MTALLAASWSRNDSPSLPLTFGARVHDQSKLAFPRPRAHLVTYHGVLAPAAAMRAAIVPAAPTRRRRACATTASRPRVCGRHPWAELLRRVFAVDVLRCPRCGGRRQLLAAITEGRVVRAMLASLGLPTEPPAVHPARGPPEEMFWG